MFQICPLKNYQFLLDPFSALHHFEVKRMPYPYRAILDAGVCAGLSWGMGVSLGQELRAM